MAESIKIDGLSELRKAMLGLPQKLDRKICNAALKAGAAPMVKAAKSSAPIRTGRLRAAIYSRAARPTEGNTATVTVAVHGAKMVEKTSKSGKTKAVWKRAKDFVYYWLHQEFGTSKMAAHPFMRPAFEGNKAEAAHIIKDELLRQVKKEAAKLSRK